MAQGPEVLAMGAKEEPLKRFEDGQLLSSKQLNDMVDRINQLQSR